MLCTLPYAVFALMQPFFVGGLLRYVDTGKVDVFHNEVLTNGYAVALILGVATMIVYALFGLSFVYITKWGLFFRESVRSIIFYKSLRLSAASKGKYSTGQIMTLMSVDIERIWMATFVFNWSWLGMVVILSALVVLSYLVGTYAVLAASFVMLAVNLTQFIVGKFVGSTRRKLVRHTENRIKLTNEALLGVRVVKLYGWELPIINSINDVRGKEMGLLFTYQFLKMTNHILAFLGPVFIAFAVFVTYVLTEERDGGEMTVPFVYTVYSFITMVRLPLTYMPLAWSNLAEGVGSLSRVSDYLMLEEIDDIEGKENSAMSSAPTTVSLSTSSDGLKSGDIELASLSSDSNSKHITKDTTPVISNAPLVVIENADFDWELNLVEGTATPVPPVLRNINFSVFPGEMVAIVGAVGSGNVCCYRHKMFVCTCCGYGVMSLCTYLYTYICRQELPSFCNVGTNAQEERHQAYV